MKKLLCSVLLMVLSSPILAEESEAEIKITSWYQLDRENRRDSAAEVCGKISNYDKLPTMIKIHADHRSKNGGLYYAYAGPDGRFCHVVSTFYGTVEVSLVADPSISSKLIR